LEEEERGILGKPEIVRCFDPLGAVLVVLHPATISWLRCCVNLR
jgi:hypothetical protein